MTRKQFMKTAAGAAAAPLFAQRPKRNIVLILSDDHRYDMLSSLGHPWVETPHLDRLLAGGAHFQNAFVTTSLCSPSRASILTGLYAHQHGIVSNVQPLPHDAVTFPKILQQHGYETALIGKWHMGEDVGDEPQPGFDHWVSFEGQGTYYDPLLNFNGERRQLQGYTADILSDQAVEFIRKERDQPFCLYLSHKSVHGPFQPAKRHAGSYHQKSIPYPANMADTDDNYRGKPDWLRRQRNSWHGVDGIYNNRTTFDDFYYRYTECVRALDDSIGGVVRELEAQNMLDDTLIIYLGDNGFLLGEHGLIDKRVMHEESIRIPMLAHCPALIPAGTKVDALALNIDVAPTILDVAGAAQPASFHGRSLAPLFQGAAPGWREDFLYEYFWERNYPQTPSVLGLRTPRYSYMHYQGVWDLDELYDIQADPRQKNNLMADVRIGRNRERLLTHIKDPELKSLVAGFQARIANIMKQTGGTVEPNWQA